MEDIIKMLEVARENMARLPIDIPRLKQPPTQLIGALETHLRTGGNIGESIEKPELQEETREQKKAELITEVAKAVRQMHDHGFEHHDLFLRNMMISGQDMSNLYIMDAPRAYFWPQFIMRMRRSVDLATLDAAATQLFTRSQRMRFMHLYLNCNKLTDQDKKLIWQILDRAKPIRERQLSRLERSIEGVIQNEDEYQLNR